RMLKRSASRTGRYLAECSLLESHDHTVRPDQALYAGPLDPDIFHPLPAVRPGEVESAMGFNEHIEAHEQPKGIVLTGVVDKGLVNDHRSAERQRVVGLAKEHHFFVQVPVVEDMAHDNH